MISRTAWQPQRQLRADGARRSPIRRWRGLAIVAPFLLAIGVGSLAIAEGGSPGPPPKHPWSIADQGETQMFTSNEAPGNYKVKNNGPDDIIISVKDENGELVDPEYPKAVGANTTTAPFGIGQDETLFIEDPDSSPDEDGASGWAQGPFN